MQIVSPTCWMLTNQETAWIREEPAQFHCFSVTPDDLEELCIVTNGRFKGFRGGPVSFKLVLIHIPITATPKLFNEVMDGASVEWDVCLTVHCTRYTHDRILKELNWI